MGVGKAETVGVGGLSSDCGGCGTEGEVYNSQPNAGSLITSPCETR